MPYLADLWFRLRALLRPGSMERELDQELAFHLEMETEKLVREGHSPTEASVIARRRLDGAVRPRQVVRDAWGIAVLRDAATDIRHALRQFRRRPGYSLLGILTLGLGLGATVGLYGVIRSVLLKPLPIADEDGVRVFWADFDWRGVEFDFLKERSRAFGTLAAFSADGATLRSSAGTRVLLKGVVSAEFFDVLGVRPHLGRTFRRGEDRPGAEPVVVLGYGTWQRELGGDSTVIGRRLNLDGTMVTVVGVMPRGFYFPTPEYQVWAPLLLDPASGEYQGNGWLVLIGRLREGTSEGQIADDLVQMTRALGERFTYPAAWDKTKNPSVRTARTYLVGDVRPALLLLFGAGGMLLLMACANVAALVLARTTDRAQEIGLRTALGAGRGRLVRQIVAESLTFALLASAVGLGLARLGFGVLVARLPLANGVGGTVSLDWTAVLAALGLAVTVAVAVSLAPVRDLLRGGLAGSARSRGGARATGRVHQGLVAVEAAVAVLLVAGAMLLVRSVAGLLDLDLGFDPRGVAAVDLAATGEDFTGPERRQLYDALLERARANPAVEAAAWTNRLPIRDGGWQGPVSVLDVPDLQGKNAPNALYRLVSTDYFRTMGIPIVRGRGLEPSDQPGTTRVAVINRAFAERAWPGQDPIGRRLALGVSNDTVTVVGIAAEVRSTAITGDNPFVTYVPDAQREGTSYKILVIRSGARARQAVAEVERIARALDPRIAVNRPTTLDDEIAIALAQPLRLRFFLSLFGGLALALGMAGIYSVASYSVSRRQIELGLRMALGATPRNVLGQVVGEGVAPVAVGTVAGLGAAVLLARGSTRFLYGVTPFDPIAIVGAAFALLAAGALAALVPAVRASRVSPVQSLRAE